MLVLELLKYATSEPPSSPPDRITTLLDQGHEREVRWVIDAGLGPLLYHATRDQFDRVPPEWRDVLLSAELSAQVRSGNLIDAAIEVIEACEEAGAPVTLLKGISISDQYYPAAHLRPMADIDVLIPRHAYDSVESTLLSRGYCRHETYTPAEDPHHGIPLFHAERQVWAELHTTLFPSDDGLRSNQLFSPSQVDTQAIASSFHGLPVSRLSDELQIIYIASSWMRDLTLFKVHPSFLIPLIDAVYLLKASPQTLDWGGVEALLDNDIAAASLYVMLAYLARCGLAPCAPAILSQLASRQHLVGAIQLRVMHALLERYLIRARPWNSVLPLPVVGRYSLKTQLRKRWPSQLFKRP